MVINFDLGTLDIEYDIIICWGGGGGGGGGALVIKYGIKL